MIKLFDILDKIYTSNGDKILQPFKATIRKEDNGEFYLDIQSSLEYSDFLLPNQIIVAPTPQGEQAFRIGNVEKTRSKIRLRAKHVFYDTENYLIEDSYVVDKNCNDALDHLNSATSDTSPYNTISNVTNINSFRCVRKSLYEALQVVLERWGGHLVRNNWTIGIYDEIGQDNGVTIRYAKNLKDITATYDWNNVVTKLMPVGKEGLLLNDLDPTASVYVESATQYAIPFTKTVSFDQNDIDEDDYKDEDGVLDENAYKTALIDDLRSQAQNYVDTNSIPQVNYTLSANVEKVTDIGDRIEVIDEKLGINITTSIIAYEYDCILDKYTQLEFGNFTPKLTDLMNNITNETETLIQESSATIQVTLNNELEKATSEIWNALSSSYVIYEGDKILIVDTLPKEDATNVIMINNGGIGFSQTGINGTFQSAWTIDNTLNMEQINVINLTADLIKGGTLKLGSNLNQNGQIEVYDEENTLIAELNKNGLKMYGVDGSYVVMNNDVGFAGYDRNDNKIYWVSQDEFHMKKSVVEEEITLCNKLRFIPILLTDENKNFLDINTFVKGRINSSTGQIEYANNTTSMTISGDTITFTVSQAWNSGIASDFIPVTAGDYAFIYSHNREISMYIDTYDSGKGHISRILAYTTSSSPTTKDFQITDSSAAYIRVHFEVNTATTYTVSNMQIKKTGNYSVLNDGIGLVNVSGGGN